MTTDPSSAPWTESELGGILCAAGVWDDPSPTIEIAGDGNINWVRRLRSHVSGRTVVVKHARPALEKFPEYSTSTERIVFENRYYEIARPLDATRVCPTIVHFDTDRRLLVLEDLADAERLDAALLRGADVDDTLLALASFLGRVHAGTWDRADLVPRFRNQDIQGLHGAHVFELPYEGQGFSVPTGVDARAARIRADEALAGIAKRARARYAEPRGALVHGDVQPGNVLLRDGRPVLLDAEIAHVGDPAFDVGTLLAHVWLARLVAPPSVPASRQASTVWAAYVQALGPAGPIPFSSVSRYAGLEMMRRTIGAARVAAVETSEASLRAIEIAERLVRSPPAQPEEISIP